MSSWSRKQSLVWGSLLIVFGVMSFVETIFNPTPWLWVAVLAISGLGVFAVYLTDRSEWGFLITTYALWATTILIALAILDIVPGTFIAIYVLVAIALPFLVVYLRNREYWWALIPAYVLLAIGAMLLLTEWNILPDAFIATFVLTAIALPFLVVFLRHRANWWALIPAYVLLVVGIMVPLLDYNVLTELWIPAYIMFAIAIPFFVVYMWDPKEWWPLIPGGILAFIGSAFLLSTGAARYLTAVVLIVVGIIILTRQFRHIAPPDEFPEQE